MGTDECKCTECNAEICLFLKKKKIKNFIYLSWKCLITLESYTMLFPVQIRLGINQ